MNDISTILELAKTNNVNVDIRFSNSGETITVCITGRGVSHIEQFDRSEFVLPLAHHVAQAIDNFNEVPKGDIFKALKEVFKKGELNEPEVEA